MSQDNTQTSSSNSNLGWLMAVVLLVTLIVCLIARVQDFTERQKAKLLTSHTYQDTSTLHPNDEKVAKMFKADQGQTLFIQDIGDFKLIKCPKIGSHGFMIDLPNGVTARLTCSDRALVVSKHENRLLVLTTRKEAGDTYEWVLGIAGQNEAGKWVQFERMSNKPVNLYTLHEEIEAL